MGRNLPWEKPPAQAVHLKSSTARRTQYVQAANSVVDGASARTRVSDTAEFTKSHNLANKRVNARTPSTSPPPGPPPFSPMRTGYDKDDVYIMVEDEFCSVAQSYTAHLHHAEYKRLMRKARDAPPIEIADLSPNKPRDVRDRFKREKLKERQRSALGGMLAGHSTKSSGEEDLIEDNNDRNVTRSWRNTGLAGLMRDGSQTKTSLIGLDRLPSSTKAAMGYRNSHGNDTEDHRNSSRRVDQDEKSINDIFKPANRRRPNPNANSADHPVETDDTVNEKGRNRAGKRARLHLQADTIEEQRMGKTKGPEGNYYKPSAKKSDKSKRSVVDALEEDDEDDHDHDDYRFSNMGRSSRLKHGASLQGKQPGNAKGSEDGAKLQKDKKSRLDEVPMFMF